MSEAPEVPTPEEYHKRLVDWFSGALRAGMRITYTEWRNMGDEERNALAEAGYDYHADLTTRLAQYFHNQESLMIERALTLGEKETLSDHIENQAFAEWRKRQG